MRDSYSIRFEIDLYRDEDGQLLQVRNDEPIQEFEGLETIQVGDDATLILHGTMHTYREPRTFDPPYPGHWEREAIRESVWLEIDRKRIDLPVVTQDAVWELAMQEIDA